MCGICGIIEFSPISSDITRLGEKATVMMNTMKQRGPDAQGLFSQGNMVFGHRRLKIFDLSEKSQQPMVDSTLGLAIVYNGAIYNYRELRKKLEEKGYSFFSTGDTEVLLKAYHAWGISALDKINGMFAFAIWHRESGKIVLGRDRLGIKPLYYAVDNKQISFASSLPALIAAGDIDTSINPEALHYYMTFHSVVPPPHTILNGIKKVPPGTVLTVDAKGNMEAQRYWQLPVASPDSQEILSFAEWKSLLGHKLRESVQRRTVADVPVGVLLSGGLDSSLVVGLLAEAGQQEINTFSVGFETVGEEKGDEFQYSDIIASHYGTKHHKIQVDSSGLLGTLRSCVTAMNEPMVSHDCIGFYLLSKEVSRHVKVVQSGQGADEVFAGYHWYPPMLECDNPVNQYAKVFFDGDHNEYCTIVNPRFHEADYSRLFVENFFSQHSARAIDSALNIDTTVMLIDDPVKRVDNMTMAWGLEARVPFLDHELVEFASRVPAELKVEKGGKYI